MKHLLKNETVYTGILQPDAHWNINTAHVDKISKNERRKEAETGNGWPKKVTYFTCYHAMG